ncbi:MAG TPA: Uma2 family endonuclease [Phycisphaerae bacterium]
MPVPLEELVDKRTLLMPWSVDQYHHLIAAGFLPEGEPYELLDGLMVRKDRTAAGEDPLTVGHEHAFAVDRLAGLRPKLERLGCYIRIQQPITLPPYDEPEPDGAIVLGTEEDYAARHPGAKDVLCVIEVADASLARDRTAKLRIYADSGLPQYVIVDLGDRTAEVYRAPLKGKRRYGQSITLTASQMLELPGAERKSLSVRVRRFFPLAQRRK